MFVFSSYFQNSLHLRSLTHTLKSHTFINSSKNKMNKLIINIAKSCIIDLSMQVHAILRQLMVTHIQLNYITWHVVRELKHLVATNAFVQVIYSLFNRICHQSSRLCDLRLESLFSRSLSLIRGSRQFFRLHFQLSFFSP